MMTMCDGATARVRDSSCLLRDCGDRVPLGLFVDGDCRTARLYGARSRGDAPAWWMSDVLGCPVATVASARYSLAFASGAPLAQGTRIEDFARVLCDALGMYSNAAAAAAPVPVGNAVLILAAGSGARLDCEELKLLEQLVCEIDRAIRIRRPSAKNADVRRAAQRLLSLHSRGNACERNP